ncbi:MAG TPA: hypothetical protein VK611_28465 [Acidimicrobiales bacterium]|nr:hypothetical protein [Acidimicrobiales bacterium]
MTPIEPAGERLPPRRMSPEAVRNATFNRTMLGRRGVSEDEVQGFAHRVADELAAREADNTRLVDENRRLKQAMRDWQAQRLHEPVVERHRVDADAAALLAQAQQHVDAQLAQAELYCRQREEEAVRRYDDIVRQAREQAAADAERVAHEYRASAGPSYSSDKERIQRQRVYLGAMLKALDAVGEHLQATRAAFSVEVSNLDDWLEQPDDLSSLEAPLAPLAEDDD